MAKKIEKKEIWVIAPVDESNGYLSYKEAVETAKNLCDIEGEDYRVMKVVESHLVSVPDDPEPEESEESLDDLLE